MESGAQIHGGVNVYPKGFQKTISELCHKYGMLLILDEIATGFGRLGNMVEILRAAVQSGYSLLGKGSYRRLLTSCCYPLQE